MYLLNLATITSKVLNPIEFTFHYVSIKSMGKATAQGIKSAFTFHYVSIKSDNAQHNYQGLQKFTFHYVSIKSNGLASTAGDVTDLHSTMYLLNPTAGDAGFLTTHIYIPLCIY